MEGTVVLIRSSSSFLLKKSALAFAEFPRLYLYDTVL